MTLGNVIYLYSDLHIYFWEAAASKIVCGQLVSLGFSFFQ